MFENHFLVTSFKIQNTYKKLYFNFIYYILSEPVINVIFNYFLVFSELFMFNLRKI